MCDRLVGRIDQVDSEVSSMLERWRGVEEGGKSLQDASQKLLDERVRPRALFRIQHLSSLDRYGKVIYGCAVLTGPTGGVARGYWHNFGILPGARTRDAFAQSSRRVFGPPNGLSLYGRARGRLHRIPQVPRTADVLVFHASYLTHPFPDSEITKKQKYTCCGSNNA